MSDGPLSGIVVVEAAERIVGPLAGMHLQLLGADVIKVDADADAARGWGEGEVFAVLNTGKRIVAGGDGALAEALGEADAAVVDEGPAADAAIATLNGGAGRLRTVVVVEQHAVPGASGTSETVAQAALAFVGYVGDADGPPARIGADLGDATAGVQAAQAVLAGLLKRDGHTVAKVSNARALATMKTIHVAGRTDPAEWEGYHITAGARPPDQGYQVADGRMSFEFPPNLHDGWTEFCRRLGLDDFVAEVGDDWYSTVGMGERSDWARLRYEAALTTKTRDEAVELARSLGAWAVPFLAPEETLSHGQTERYGAVRIVGGRASLASPWKVAGVDDAVLVPGGEDGRS